MNNVVEETNGMYIRSMEKLGSELNGEFNSELFEKIVFQVVDTIEEFSSSLPKKLTGSEKRNFGIKVVKMVLVNLQETGKIEQETCTAFSEVLTFVSESLFHSSKLLWKKTNPDSGIAHPKCFSCI
jgi:hypothetical protein